MVNLYLLNPAHKLRVLSGLVFKASKRILKDLKAQPTAMSQTDQPTRPKFNFGVLDLIKSDLRHDPQGGIHDTEYYHEERDSGLCIFRVENTLFKVHKCYLMREPCAFGDMFNLPFIRGSNEGHSDEGAITLFDTAEQFRDLLWALYAIPSQLFSYTESDPPSLDRLLNIAQLANKYCISSYETWALDRLVSLAENPSGFLRHAPPEICARALEVATLCDHKRLLETVIQRLVPRMLWSDVNRQLILDVAEKRGITKLQGVAYYKELVELERASQDSCKEPTSFLDDALAEKQASLYAAHQSLVNLWESVCLNPPTFLSDDCLCHAECLSAWSDLWLNAATSNQTLRHGSADVLGRLKSMMIILKKSMIESNAMTLGCTLAALESITSMREDVIAGLIDHFYEH